MSEALHPVVSRPLQARFLTIPQTPLCYWLRDRFFELLAGPTLGDVADVCQGLATADDARFVRFVWEVPPDEWALPVRGRRWVPFEKGGGYGKWFGHHFWAVDWEREGARIKAFPTSVVRNEQHYFKEGRTYSSLARGSVGARFLEGSLWGAVLADAVFAPPKVCVSVLLNGRLASAATRWMRTSMVLSGSYVSRVPFPERIPNSLGALEFACIALKHYLVALDATERGFGGIPVTGVALTEAARRLSDETEAVAAVLLTLEGLSEREVLSAYGIAGDDLQAVIDETGTPAAWFTLLAGHEAVPELPAGLDIPQEAIAPLRSEPKKVLISAELAALRRQLRRLYEAAPGGEIEDDEEEQADEPDDEENDAASSGARIPIPAETLLEELSQTLEIHPISIYWLLRELREQEGVVCKPELQRFVEDYFSVMVLRLLGHRWPKQVEAGEPLPAWADEDGIIPITSGTNSPTLLSRVRERIAADFGTDRVVTIEQEFRGIVGESLETWLGSTFFRRHIGQFKKRPIAWQIQSVPAQASGGRRRGRGRRRVVSRRGPAFSCVVYYHRLDGDFLPRLRTHALGPLVRGLQTELGDLERLTSRSGEQDARRLQLEDIVQELKDLDGRLEAVSTTGFRSDALERLSARESLDRWTSRDGQARPPASREAFLTQESRYDPDLNDGVRVNIAPLQRAGVLAADVLATRDVENAIGDRTEWRADERRWCREGKLPRPGWWPPDESKGTARR